MMVEAGPDEKFYPAAKVAAIVDALAAEGVSATDALKGIDISKSDLSSPATRVSLNQVIECYHNAARLSRDPCFAFHAGLKVHVSTYGMYGFAFLSGMDFHKTMQFAVKYHQLATPLAEISFKEEGQRAVWTIAPIAHPRVDAPMYKFLVELQFGIHLSLLRDVMGSSFAARELAVTYSPPDQAQTYPAVFGCELHFERPENKFVFDALWLDRAPELGNEITYSAVVKLCDTLMDELELRVGTAGKVREMLLVNLMRPTSFDTIAGRLHTTTRTLRRKLDEENTSFRKLVDELRMHVAIKYLRETDLTVEEIAYSLGFSDAAAFRRAFRRWTNRGPLEFRDLSGGEVRRAIRPR